MSKFRVDRWTSRDFFFALAVAVLCFYTADAIGPAQGVVGITFLKSATFFMSGIFALFALFILVFRIQASREEEP